VKNIKERISILAVDVLDLHLLPEQVVSFQNSRFWAFSFLLLVKNPLISIFEF